MKPSYIARFSRNPTNYRTILIGLNFTNKTRPPAGKIGPLGQLGQNSILGPASYSQPSYWGQDRVPGHSGHQKWAGFRSVVVKSEIGQISHAHLQEGLRGYDDLLLKHQRNIYFFFFLEKGTQQAFHHFSVEVGVSNSILSGSFTLGCILVLMILNETSSTIITALPFVFLRAIEVATIYLTREFHITIYPM